jgi:putative tryptophan/tyrosine transport system substrate-binding protein
MIVVRDAGSVLVHAHNRGIDHLHRRVMTDRQRIQDLIPDARAQQGERMRRIGVLIPSPADDRVYQARLAAFFQGLLQLGWIDGRNVRIDTRWAAGDADLIRRYAEELAALGPDVVMAFNSVAVQVLRQVTQAIPIVFAVVADPVGGGYVESQARPGGTLQAL